MLTGWDFLVAHVQGLCGSSCKLKQADVKSDGIQKRPLRNPLIHAMYPLQVPRCAIHGHWHKAQRLAPTQPLIVL